MNISVLPWLTVNEDSLRGLGGYLKIFKTLPRASSETKKAPGTHCRKLLFFFMEAVDFLPCEVLSI
jgi:hypothetical protein